MEHDELLQEILPHLLAKCDTCTALVEEIRRLQRQIGHWDEIVAVQESREAPELVARLAGLPYEEQLRQAEEEESLHAWGVCDLLLKKSRQATSSDPQRAVDFATLAVRLSVHLGDAYDPECPVASAPAFAAGAPSPPRVVTKTEGDRMYTLVQGGRLMLRRVLHAVLFEDRGWWVAQCLEHNLTASSKNPLELRGQLENVLKVQVEADLEAGKPPLSGLPPAPRRFWTLFQSAELWNLEDSLPAGTPVWTELALT